MTINNEFTNFFVPQRTEKYLKIAIFKSNWYFDRYICNTLNYEQDTKKEFEQYQRYNIRIWKGCRLWGYRHPQNLADQLTLSQPEGQIMHPNTTSAHFPDFMLLHPPLVVYHRLWLERCCFWSPQAPLPPKELHVCHFYRIFKLMNLSIS